jgi:N-methylhydantoinase A
MSWRLGIDIGGTFTDVAMIDEAAGDIVVAKVPTTPGDFGAGVLAGIGQVLARANAAPSAVSLLSHATTVVTNALLEAKGARCGFVATRGFRDLLELRRSSKASLYDLMQDGPAILVPRRWRYEITERIGADGTVVAQLAEDEVPALAQAIRAAGLRAVAVCFLFSFLNDAHERRFGALLRAALPDIPVFLSCEILPEIREYERASTTTVCAYVAPLLASYLERLEAATRALGLPRLHVMGSSGGILDIPECLRMPAAVVESGPAAGVMAAALVGRQLGLPDLISFDMGGAANAKRWMHGTGHPIRVPVVDLAEVSAGGGSIAWLDPGGALEVGPHSAGAVPGPAAYGLGGTQPTVTDANVVLGYLDPASPLADTLAVDAAAAAAAIDRHIATPLGIPVADAAAKIIRVVNANMCEALRIVSIERGLDPRQFSLVAFGGAGPIHAAALAAELAIPEIIIPPAPGAFSALGLIATDLRRDYARTLFTELGGVAASRVAEVIGGMEAQGTAMLHAAGVAPAQRDMLRFADLRYTRQAYELTVPLDGGAITPSTLLTLATAFHARHRQTYGHANPDEPVQLVNLRVTAIGRLPTLRLAQQPSGQAAAPRARAAWFPDTGQVAVAVRRREHLAPGDRLVGPTIVDALDCTAVIPPGWTGSVDAQGFIRLRRA